MKEKRREPFLFYFWVSPFDLYTWIPTFFVFIVSEFILPYLSTKFKKTIKGRILRILTIIFLFGFSQILCHYESIISSKLTVQPPVIKINSLKELLIDYKYKINGITQNDDLTPLFELFNKTKIPSPYKNYITYPNITTTHSYFEKLTECNGSSFIVLEYVNTFSFLMLRDYNLSSCYNMPQNFITENINYHYSGIIKERMYRAGNILYEGGILEFYYSVEINSGRFLYHKEFREYEIEKFKEENIPQPLKVKDWKIISIFIIFIVLITLSFIVFLIEFCFALLNNIIRIGTILIWLSIHFK